MDNSVSQAISVLQAGGTIIYPTETVIGLGCDALNVSAIKRLNKLKKRPAEKSFIVLMDSIEQLKQYQPQLSKLEIKLLLSPSPTTLIISGLKNLPQELMATDGSLGVRISKHPLSTQLIRGLNKPIVSTSANYSGEPTAKSWKELNPQILEQVDYSLNLQLDFLTTQKPSRIVKVVNGELNVIRH